MALPSNCHRRASELLEHMNSLEAAKPSPTLNSARQRLQHEAASLGLKLKGLTITNEPVPDPAFKTLPKKDLARIEVISRAMKTSPAQYALEIELLIVRFPHIAMLRNQLAGAYAAAGRMDRAESVVAQTVKDFPTYVFAFCNHIKILLSTGEIEAARALVETGPRGPVFMLSDFDASRDTFHISEAVAQLTMVGHYMIATGRPDVARVQLDVLRHLAPDSVDTRNLAAALDPAPANFKYLFAQASSRLNPDHRKRRTTKSAKTTKPAEGTNPTQKQAAQPTPKRRRPDRP